jgi:hypothetical protein
LLKSEIQFNEKTLESFEKEELEPPHGTLTLKAQYDKFKAQFKEDKGPLQQIITRMHRKSKIVFDEEGKAVKKDYLTYEVDYHAKNWLSNDLFIRGHIHGMHHEPKFRATTKLDPETGNHIINNENDGIQEVYDIELTDKNRKQVIQDIINKSIGSLIDNIKFYGHFESSIKGPSFRCDQFSYDQFINSSFDELEALARKQGGPQGNAPRLSKDKKSYMG